MTEYAIEELLMRMKQNILADEEIRKLLFYTSDNALSKPAPSAADVTDKIFFYPFAIDKHDKDIFLAINWDDSESATDGTIHTFKISCGILDNVWEMGNQLRPMQLMGRVRKILENMDTNMSSRISITHSSAIYYSPRITGIAFIAIVLDAKDTTIANEL